MFISIIQGAIDAASNPPGLSSGAVRGNDMIHIAVRARERSFHPVRDYLDALKWDGVIRIGSDRGLAATWARPSLPIPRPSAACS